MAHSDEHGDWLLLRASRRLAYLADSAHIDRYRAHRFRYSRSESVVRTGSRQEDAPDAGSSHSIGTAYAGQAFWFGVALEVLGSLELWLGVNALTSLLGIATIALYLFAYTPLKQKTWWSTTMGAFPGAIPPLIGFAGAANTLTPEAWALFGIRSFLAIPSFLCHRVDVPRRLCAGWHSDAAGG